MPKNARGNILFLILLAVVLFAALSYAVTSSMRGGGKDMSDESARAGAAVITQYVTLLRNEVQRLMLVNNCTIDNLDWRHDTYKRYSGSFTSAGTPASPKQGCAIFQSRGGAITAQTFEKYKNPEYENIALASQSGFWMAGHGALRWVNRKHELTEANDIAIIIQGLNASVCRYLIHGNTTTPLPGEGYEMSSNAGAAVAQITNLIDDPANMNGDFFANRINTYGMSDWCELGAVILPQ